MESNHRALPDFMTLWDFQHPDSTEMKFREILPAARSAEDADYLAQLLTQIARAQGLQGKFEGAHATLDDTEKILQDSLPRARVRYLLERGRVFNSAGSPDQARPLFLHAWELAAAETLDALAVDAAHMMAIVEGPDAGLEWNHKALGLVEQSEDERVQGWRGPLYNNLGWDHHDRGEYEEALALFQKGWEWRRRQPGQERETRIAKWTVARALRSLGQMEKALQMQQELLTEWEKAGGESGYVEEETGECLLALGRSEEAGPHFARAYQLLSQDAWLSEHEGARLERLAELGGLREKR